MYNTLDLFLSTPQVPRVPSRDFRCVPIISIFGRFFEFFFKIGNLIGNLKKIIFVSIHIQEKIFCHNKPKTSDGGLQKEHKKLKYFKISYRL